MLAVLVDEKYFPSVKQNINRLTLQIRKDIAALLGFYSTKNSQTLCNMFELLLPETKTSTWFFWSRKLCDDAISESILDRKVFNDLTAKHQDIRVKLDRTNTDALKVLVAMKVKTGYDLASLLERSYRDQLRILVNFLNMVDIGITVIMDSLDETEIFFDKQDVNFSALQTFVNSSVNDEVLQMALGNWGNGGNKLNKLSFHFFIPEIPKAPFNISWSRQDKIPVTKLEWDELKLINYANYVLDHLRKQAKHQCRRLPDICSLFGDEKLCSKYIRLLRHPRDLNIFFTKLIQTMNTVYTKRNLPFIATEDDLEAVRKIVETEVLKED
ncbi:unnamed protein product [Adineta ricciae]|uniref:Uncharacterized protein n=1 Tax=Adineta ricciae TaxID=249248 RepID=A0A815QFX3_ADIRI|nr:unnamed protein product [Adineta ricciae]CAF1462302.1 unnamed protein product [Adineta ricciae]